MTKFLKWEEETDFAAEQIIPLQIIPAEPTLRQADGGEAEADSTPTSSEVAGEAAYQQRTEGPLTYYQYYFNEQNFGQNAALKAPEMIRAQRSSLLTPGLIGAGVVTATVASGFLIADAMQHKPPVVPAEKPPDAQTKQQASTPLTTPKPTGPEQIALNRSSLTKSSLATKTSQPASKLPAKSDLPTVAIESTLGLPPVIGTGETFGFQTTLSGSATSAIKAKPSVSQPQPSTSTSASTNAASPVSPVIAPTAAPPTTPATAGPVSSPMLNIAPPETLPSGITNFSAPPTSPERQNTAPSQPPAPPVSGESSPPGASQTPVSEQPTETPASTTDERSLNSVSPALPNSVGPSTIADASKVPASPQSIQEFLKLPSQTAIELKTLSLPKQAADEAIQSKALNGFTVRHLAAPEYQTEWQASMKRPNDSTAVVGMPSYGFIDYQRRVIAVLKDTLSDKAVSLLQPNLNQPAPATSSAAVASSTSR